jgi:hypothetical protein
MKGAGSAPQPVSGGDASPTAGRTLVIIIAAALAILLVAAVTIVLVVRAGDGTAPPGPAATATPTTSTSASTSPSPSTTPSTSPTAEPTQPGPSATEALDPFFAAADTLDRQLQAAAAAINASGPPWEEVGDDIASAVRAADLDPVERTISAGLPHDLQQAVILVFSDLASRRMAMHSFSYPETRFPDDFYSVDEHGNPYYIDDEGTRLDVRHATTAQLIEELENGHEAATRFEDDLAAARALAAATPPIEPVPTESRLTAEILILVNMVRINNQGCDARGGAVLTHLPTVTWGPVPDNPDAEGTLDSIVRYHIINGVKTEVDPYVSRTPFDADLQPDGTWNVGFFFC